MRTKFLFTVFTIWILIWSMAIVCSPAQTVNSTVSNSSTILGMDTSTFFTFLETATKNAIQSWNGITIDKDLGIKYQMAYDLYETKPIIKDEMLTFAAGVITDWHYSGGVDAGFNAFPKDGTMETQLHFNLKVAGFVEGTLDPALNRNWNAGAFIAGRINLDSVLSSSSKILNK